MSLLNWTLVFLVIALVAAFFGFAGIAAVAVDLAQIIFFIALVPFLISLILSLARNGKIREPRL